MNVYRSPSFLYLISALALLVGCVDPTDADLDGYPFGEDCDDNDSAVNPGAAEIDDGIDNDCDGQIDNATNIDGDSDGYSPEDGDCSDDVPSVHPGALEILNGLDDDCDGVIDDHLPQFDGDGDCFCAAGPCTGSSNPGCATLADNDCADNDATVFPGAAEIDDGIDNNCDGQRDEGLSNTDGDSDGYSPEDGDCSDDVPSVHPGALEILNGLDDDCDGVIDDHLPQFDGDGDCFCAAGPCTGSSNPGCATLADNDCDNDDPTVYPEAEELLDGLDNNCNGLVDELERHLSQIEEESLLHATQSGPRTETLTESMYLTTGATSGLVRSKVIDGATGLTKQIIEVPTHPILPARGIFPAAPVNAYVLQDGTVQWSTDPTPPAGGTLLGELQLADPWPLAQPLEPGDEVQRKYVSLDALGTELSTTDGPSLVVGDSTPPLVSDKVIAVVTLEGNGVKVIDDPEFDPARDLLIFSEQVQKSSSEKDWSWDCVPEARSAGGISIRCTTDFDSTNSNGKTLVIRKWRSRSPAKIRCIDQNGSAQSCAVPPTITVNDNERVSSFVECPFGYRCLVVVSPLGEFTSTDDDCGWGCTLAPADPLRDAGAGAIQEIEDASGGQLPSGYLANLQGYFMRLDSHGGNSGSYQRYLVAELLIPVTYPVFPDMVQVRSLSKTGFTAERALCYPQGALATALIAPVVTEYDPHFQPGPSFFSRLKDVLVQAAATGAAVYETVVKPTPTGVAGSVKSVLGLLDAIFGLGDPASDTGGITNIAVTQNASDPNCIDVSTVIQNADTGAPDMETGLTVYTIFQE